MEKPKDRNKFFLSLCIIIFLIIYGVREYVVTGSVYVCGRDGTCSDIGVQPYILFAVVVACIAILLTYKRK